MRGTAFMLLAALAVIPSRTASAQPPELEFWMLNVSGLTGYNDLPANVQRIRYSATNAYVNCSCIPLYSIGPWPGNPNTPSNKAYLFRIPRAPVANAGTKTDTPLGPIAVWTNGVVAFNAKDAMSYNNQNVWHQNAVVVEGPSFDGCLGHPAPDGAYHQHQNPACLYTADSAQHSPIVGYAFDGFPIYGPYGYANPDGSGGIARMRSGYRARSITTRTTLPGGTVLPPSQYGPPVSGTYPLGYYIEDFEFDGILGDLDAYNGRFTVTPEYPAGIHAYFVTIDASGGSAYPYVIGPSYYGVVANDNITTHGHVTIGETVADYVPSRLEVPSRGPTFLELAHSQPNPCGGRARVTFAIPARDRVTLRVFDLAGRAVSTALDEVREAGTHTVPLDLESLPTGLYFYRLRVRDRWLARRLILAR